MTTYHRICIQDFELTAQNGDRLVLKRGQEYLTSEVRKEDNTLVVITNYWVRVPANLFAGEILFTGENQCEHDPDWSYFQAEATKFLPCKKCGERLYQPKDWTWHYKSTIITEEPK
jgi:hypothetical protein